MYSNEYIFLIVRSYIFLEEVSLFFEIFPERIARRSRREEANHSWMSRVECKCYCTFHGSSFENMEFLRIEEGKYPCSRIREEDDIANTFFLEYFREFTEVISSVFTTEKDCIDSTTECRNSCNRTLRSRRDGIIIESYLSKDSDVFEAVGKSSKCRTGISDDFCIDAENMSDCKD